MVEYMVKVMVRGKAIRTEIVFNKATALKRQKELARIAKTELNLSEEDMITAGVSVFDVTEYPIKYLRCEK